MRSKPPLTLRDQVLNTLRDGLRSRRWAGVLPGVRPLAAELGVSIGTLQDALKRLESEGLLLRRGAGLPREVAPAAVAPLSPRVMRVGVMLHEPVTVETALNQVLLYGILHALEEAGHRPFFAPKSMQTLRHDPVSIRNLMTECEADAWVVSNARRPLLASLATDFPVPVIALGGPANGLDIAAVRVNIRPAIRESVRRLVALGHGRIVLLFPPWHRKPEPSPAVLAFIEELAAVGLKAGPYHIPDWEHSGEGFNALLRSLFTLTPPTALIMDDARQMCAVYAFLAARRIPPGDLALILLGTDPSLDWVTPPPVRLNYDNEEMIRSIVSRVDTLAAGGRDLSQVFCEAHLTGGEITPPPRK